MGKQAKKYTGQQISYVGQHVAKDGLGACAQALDLSLYHVRKIVEEYYPELEGSIQRGAPAFEMSEEQVKFVSANITNKQLDWCANRLLVKPVTLKKYLKEHHPELHAKIRNKKRGPKPVGELAPDVIAYIRSYHKEKSVKDIAEALGLPQSRVKQAIEEFVAQQDRGRKNRDLVPYDKDYLEQNYRGKGIDHCSSHLGISKTRLRQQIKKSLPNLLEPLPVEDRITPDNKRIIESSYLTLGAKGCADKTGLPVHVVREYASSKGIKGKRGKKKIVLTSEHWAFLEDRAERWGWEYCAARLKMPGHAVRNAYLERYPDRSFTAKGKTHLSEDELSLVLKHIGKVGLGNVARRINAPASGLEVALRREGYGNLKYERELHWSSELLAELQEIVSTRGKVVAVESMVVSLNQLNKALKEHFPDLHEQANRKPNKFVWTKERREFLRENHVNLGDAGIARHFGISEKKVYYAKRNYLPRRQWRSEYVNRSPQNKVWTGERLAELKDICENQGIKAAAERFKRSEGLIDQVMRKYLPDAKIKRNTQFDAVRESRKEYLLKNFYKAGTISAADHLGIHPTTLNGFIHRNVPELRSGPFAITDDELDFISQNHASMPAPEMAEKLRIPLDRLEKLIKKAAHDMRIPDGSPITKEQGAFIVRNAYRGKEFLSKELGLLSKEVSVFCRINDIKVLRYSEHEAQFMRDHWGKKSLKEFADQFRVSEMSVRDLAEILGLE